MTVGNHTYVTRTCIWHRQQAIHIPSIQWTPAWARHVVFPTPSLFCSYVPLPWFFWAPLWCPPPLQPSPDQQYLSLWNFALFWTMGVCSWGSYIFDDHDLHHSWSKYWHNDGQPTCMLIRRKMIESRSVWCWLLCSPRSTFKIRSGILIEKSFCQHIEKMEKWIVRVKDIFVSLWFSVTHYNKKCLEFSLGHKNFEPSSRLVQTSNQDFPGNVSQSAFRTNSRLFQEKGQAQMKFQSNCYFFASKPTLSLFHTSLISSELMFQIFWSPEYLAHLC